MSADIPGSTMNESGEVEVHEMSQTIVVPQDIIDAQRKVRYPFVYVAIVTVLAALATNFLIVNQKNESSLAAEIKRDPVSATATATVVTYPGRGGPHHGMTYVFSVPGTSQKFNSTQYSYEANSSLDNEEYKRLVAKTPASVSVNGGDGYQDSGPIAIVYDGSDPANNLTQQDLNAVITTSPNRFKQSAVFFAFVVWLVVLVPLGFLIRMIIRQNIWHKYEAQVMRDRRAAQMQNTSNNVI
jgi:hypothetical protein